MWVGKRFVSRLVLLVFILSVGFNYFFWHDKFQDYCQTYDVDTTGLHVVLFRSLMNMPFYPPKVIAAYCIASVL